MLAVRPMLIVPRRVFVRKWVKPRKVKVAGLIAGRPVTLQQVAVEEQHSCLLWRDVQLEGCQSLFHFLPKPLGVFPVLEHRYEVVAIPGQLRPFRQVFLNRRSNHRSRT